MEKKEFRSLNEFVHHLWSQSGKHYMNSDTRVSCCKFQNIENFPISTS